MYTLLLFTNSSTLHNKILGIVIPILSNDFKIEVADFPNTPVCIFPNTEPSAFFFDYLNSPDQLDNPWLQLLSSHFSHIPTIYFDGNCSLEELISSLIYNSNFVPIEKQYYIQNSICVNFLTQLTSINLNLLQYNENLPGFSNTAFSVCIFYPEKHDLVISHLSILTELVSNYTSSLYYFNPLNNTFLLILYENINNTLQLEIYRQTLIDNVLSKNSGLPPFKLGMIHNGLEGLISSFLEANQVYYVDKFQHPCTYFEEISSPLGQLLKSQKLTEIEHSIRTDIQFKEGQNSLFYIKQWFIECRSLNYTLTDIQYDSIILYSNIKFTLFDMYELKLKRIKSGLEVHEILSTSSTEELERWFCIWFIYTLDNFNLIRTNTGDFQINDVLQFISSHIMDDLSLSTISNCFYLNPSYFSALFKNKMGQTYISYVTKLKMDKAHELLTSNLKVYEVARLLGYKDIRHFRNIYKKHHGSLPSSIKYNKKSGL